MWYIICEPWYCMLLYARYAHTIHTIIHDPHKIQVPFCKFKALYNSLTYKTTEYNANEM